ncbi:uncharacterized protein (DUF952 family) [Sphingomonas jinjuensis]|uniref:Uncharacterized protein (DUF952 family) n=1 Tax=Sphingomonas jinjuensis TaxID=535907 RepID=A0A840FDB2_9SPHN|nr:DUF952 domain-containing protein [Sphingomonas jinjuensis]MBB4154236.1 uncharacterized protein (DUF952 family) [Sphingomonas jinjuensis]
MSERPQIAYKVLTADELATLERDGRFEGSADDRRDGFIHLSTEDQLAGTVDKHFAGVDDLQIAAIDLGSFGGSLKWEESRGGALFPHLYGPLLLEEVIAYGPLVRGTDGAIKLPIAG